MRSDVMDEFWKHAQRFWDDYDLFQREIQTEERLQELANRRGLKVEDVKAILKRIDDGCRLLHAPQRPTLEEQSRFFLEHSKEPGESNG
jgi:hypothetical protein